MLNRRRADEGGDRRSFAMPRLTSAALRASKPLRLGARSPRWALWP